jgi:hypothetical protein
MNIKQVSDLIERNKVTMLQLKDFQGNRLLEIHCTSPAAAVADLEEALQNFRDYKKVEVLGKTGTKDTPWTKGFAWQLEVPGSGAAAAIGALPAAPAAAGSIGAMDYVNMFVTMAEKQNALTEKLLQKTYEAQKDDPAKWMPIIQMIGGAVGLNMSGGIQGPPGAQEAKRELHLLDVEIKGKTDQEISALIAAELQQLAAKIKGSDMLRILSQLNKIPELQGKAENISLLLQAVSKSPELLDKAMLFI